jgi:hypothetical protein
MFKRVYLTAILTIGSIIPALAGDYGSGALASMIDPGQIALLLCAMAIAAYYAREAFDTPPIKLGDGPTLPRYMTQPRQYRLAVIAYIVICLAFYDLGTYFFKDLLPLANFVVPAGLETIISKAAANGLLTFPVTVVLAAAVFFILLNTNTEWNPLLLLRRLVWGLASIPQFANAIMLTARDALVVPIRYRAWVASDAPYVDIGDFEKVRNCLDRDWAELCYIKLSLDQNRAAGLHYSFFNEGSFAWDKLDSDYATACVDVARVKQPLGRGNVSDVAEVSKEVKLLRSKYCKLQACFLVFKNETKDKVIDEAISFGIPMDKRVTVARSNPFPYLFVFLTAIIIAISVGVTASAMIWDLLHGNSSNAMNQESELITRWMGYALANYGMPILVALLMSYLGWTVNHDQLASYPISYARIFIISLCVSALSLTLAVKFVSSNTLAAKPFFELLLNEFKWSLSPALVTLYIAYHVDRQIDPLLPDIASWESGRFRQRIIMCVVFAVIVAWLSLQPALTLTPTSPTTWPVEKLRAVIIGTTFTVGLVMALASEFCLIKPKRTAAPKVSLPSEGDGIGAHFPQPPDALPSR